MTIIGVTGGTGTGKTTVSTIIKNTLDCIVISADYVAKKINVPGTEYYKETVELFGEEILKPDKTLDRRKMAEIIFSDSEAKEKMNVITTKYVGGKIEDLIKEEGEKNPEAFVIIDAPLLFECGLDKLCDYIIAIVCESKEARIRRITVRDRLTRNQAEARIDAQPNNDFYESRADFVIHNELYYKYYKLIKDVQKVVYKIKRKVSEKQKKKEEV